MTPLDDLFSTDESRAEAQLEKVVTLNPADISDFPNHPFKVKQDEAITGGWLPPRRRPAIGLTILPSSHSPSVINGISTVKPSQAMGAVMREPREGEIPVEPTAIGRLMISL